MFDAESPPSSQFSIARASFRRGESAAPLDQRRLAPWEQVRSDGAGFSASGRDIIVFGEDWGAHPSSTQHLMRCLAGDWNILWVNSLGLRRPRMNARDFKRAISKLGARFGKSPQAAAAAMRAPFPVVAPFVLPFPASKCARRLNSELLRRRLEPLIDAAKMKHPILWTSLPTAVAAARQLGERAIVYYCGDDFSALEGVDHAPVSRLENELAFRADLIIAASQPLASRFPPEKTILAPHGVDFDLFSRPAPRAPDLPAGRPIAGYYGSIADWVDLDAIAASAQALPNWDFVLIGQVKTSIAAIERLPNVKLLGPRRHSALPSYSQHWTVSLIPFRNTPQIQACNPLKLREYLAAGRPVASTIDFPALAPYARHLTISPCPAQFPSAILEASRNGEPPAIRQAAVMRESWAARAAQVSNALEKL